MGGGGRKSAVAMIDELSYNYSSLNEELPDSLMNFGWQMRTMYGKSQIFSYTGKLDGKKGNTV